MVDTTPDFRVSDGTGPLTVDGTVVVTDGGDSLTVDAVSLPLPTGAATAADQYSGFSPDPRNFNEIPGGGTPAIDGSQNTMIRGQVLSDEGSFRDDFAGSSLTTALTGTLDWTNGSNTVTGSGTLFSSEVKIGQYIKKNADSETAYAQVETIVNDTELTLVTPYTGTTASSGGVRSNWKTNITGGSVTVGSGSVTLASSTANGNVARIRRAGDYLPFNLLFRASLSQRIANQTAILGFQDNPTSLACEASFVFDGTSNETVKCRSAFGSSASEIQTTTVTYAKGLNSSQSLLYQIDVSANQVSFLINGIVVAIHKDHLPGPYDDLELVASISNSAVVTTTSLVIDWIYFSNLDQVQISNDFTGEPQKVQLMGKSTTTGLPLDLALDEQGNLIVTALTGFNADFSFGDVTLAVVTQAAVRRTAYTEQTTNAQRSIVSANAADTAAGTGARTVQITYYTATFTGPFSETLTLNGTVAVNTVATDICYVEEIKVITVGSGGSNAGIISLKAAPAGGGATIGTIAATDKQTFWAHHYIPTGKTCNITGISTSHNGTTVGSGGLFVVKSLALGVTNAAEIQISDFVRQYGQSSNTFRSYASPIKVVGPARLVCYVTPETGSSTIYRAAIDFFEP